MFVIVIDLRLTATVRDDDRRRALRSAAGDGEDAGRTSALSEATPGALLLTTEKPPEYPASDAVIVAVWPVPVTVAELGVKHDRCDDR